MKTKTHSTNYNNTFISVAEDCPVSSAEIPTVHGHAETVATLQYSMLHEAPYRFTSDDVIFATHAAKKQIAKRDLARERELFFSKGQPCMRCSPLAKRYGWGVHSNAEGKIKLVALGSSEYIRLVQDERFKQIKAMRITKK